MGWFRRKSALDRQEEVLKAVLEASKAQSDAVAQIAKAFATYLDSFKVSSAPELREHADADAWQREEIADMEAKGLPIGATELDRLRWIARTVDFSS